jgi:anthranilate synthase/aminodeoxychorismate synthase-like glutamine amidotransferase
MILVIDNYDSFTYNLVQYFGMLGEEVKVYRNDKIDINSIEMLAPEGLVLSPGPGTPEESGICRDVIRRFSGEIPILGVCLGHQCIGDVFGFPVKCGDDVVHGKTSLIYHNQEGIFRDIPQGIRAARYHSLILEEMPGNMPLRVTGRTEDGIIMAIEHKKHPTIGVQFHPESIATEYGLEIINNFLSMTRKFDLRN